MRSERELRKMLKNTERMRGAVTGQLEQAFLYGIVRLAKWMLADEQLDENRKHSEKPTSKKSKKPAL